MAVFTFHKALELPVPYTSMFLTKLAMKGLRLLLARPIKQAEPITSQLLYIMFEQIDVNSDEQVAVWTALLYVLHMLLKNLI